MGTGSIPLRLGAYARHMASKPTEMPEEAATLSAVDGVALVSLAAATIEARLRGRAVPDEVPARPALVEQRACFVTLEVAGGLRGCIGSIDAVRPLYLDVIRNAQRAMRDPRLPPLTASEWPRLDIKVAVLSPPEAVSAETREELLVALRPGVDGLLLTDGGCRATFLPAVWDKLPDPARFVEALLAKGGWPVGQWPAGLRAARYTTAEYRDLSPRPALV